MEENKKKFQKITLVELYEAILNLPVGVEINFAEKEDGSEYYGAKCMLIFDIQVTLIGYYGVCIWQVADTLQPFPKDLKYAIDIKSAFEDILGVDAIKNGYVFLEIKE